MIRRKKATIFTDAKESTTVHEVKRIVEGILKVRPEDQRLYKDDQVNIYMLLNIGLGKTKIISDYKHQV